MTKKLTDMTLAELNYHRDTVDAMIYEGVRVARIKGVPWSEIGQQLGVSKQAAQKKFGHATI